MLSTIGPWLLASAVAATVAGADQPFDLVIHGGRVMDPESGTDSVRDIGIADGKIARIAPGELRGRRVLDAKVSSSPPVSSTCTSTARMPKTTAPRCRTG